MSSVLDRALGGRAPISQYVTTRQAADMLGVSVGTVLNLVERGQLQAWRTEGGHRRVVLDSVTALLERRGTAGSATIDEAPRGDRLSVLVIEDDEFLRDIYRDQFDAWSMPIDLSLAADGVEGLTEIGRRVPDILLIDLLLPNIDGFSVVRSLRSNTRYDAMDIIAISGLSLDEINAAGGLPAGVVAWPKPVPFAQLKGFLEARLAAMQRGFTR